VCPTPEDTVKLGFVEVRWEHRIPKDEEGGINSKIAREDPSMICWEKQYEGWGEKSEERRFAPPFGGGKNRRKRALWRNQDSEGDSPGGGGLEGRWVRKGGDSGQGQKRPEV